jgi:hypothetical protein
MEATPLIPTEPGLGILCILDGTGDTRIQWDKRNPAEVAHAKKRFDELKANGYLAYEVGRRGGQGEVMDVFDPSVERIILNAPMVGG